MLGDVSPLAEPLYTSAVYRIPDLDALDRLMTKQSPGFIYARDGHPNGKLLAEKLATLESAQWACLGASGMAAISAPILASTKAGDRIIAGNRLYGRTTMFLRDELPRYGVTTTFIDTCDLAAVEAAFAEPAVMLLVETLSNPLLRVANVPALADIAHRHGATLFVDNTFATPVLYRPLEAGADLVMESLTKLISGHSDVTLGVVVGNDLELLPKLARTISVWGLNANPFDCWMTLRGLETLELRTHAATANAVRLAGELESMLGVKAVAYPGLTSHPDAELARRLFPDGVGNMLCFELAGREAVNAFMRQSAIPFCPSLGHTRTTLSHPDTTSHRYDSPEEKAAQGITPGLIRLSVGCEPYAELVREMTKGLGIG